MPRGGGGGARGGGGGWSRGGGGSWSRATPRRTEWTQVPTDGVVQMTSTGSKKEENKQGSSSESWTNFEWLRSLADGFSWGSGSSIGQAGVEKAQGSEPPKQVEQVAPRADACHPRQVAFVECLNANVHEISRCQSLMDALHWCRTHQRST